MSDGVFGSWLRSKWSRDDLAVGVAKFDGLDFQVFAVFGRSDANVDDTGLLGKLDLDFAELGAGGPVEGNRLLVREAGDPGAPGDRGGPASLCAHSG